MLKILQTPYLTENKSQCLYYSLGGLNTVLCCDFSYVPSLVPYKLTSFLAVPPLLQEKFSSGPFCLLFPLHEELFPHLTNSPHFRSLLKYHLRESLSEDLIAPPPHLVFAFPALLFSTAVITTNMQHNGYFFYFTRCVLSLHVNSTNLSVLLTLTSSAHRIVSST